MTPRDKLILAALRMYGDMLAECLTDPALTEEERRGFQLDSDDVERLIREYDEQ